MGRILSILCQGGERSRGRRPEPMEGGHKAENKPEIGEEAFAKRCK